MTSPNMGLDPNPSHRDSIQVRRLETLLVLPVKLKQALAGPVS